MKQLIFFACSLLTTSLSLGQTKTEQLKITIPEANKFKIGYQEEDSTHRYVEFIPVKEEIYDWTSQVILSSLKGVTAVSMTAAMNSTFDQAKKTALNPALMLVEQNNTTKHPWIIFKIEASSFKDDPEPESQLYYLIQGATALFTNTVTIKENNFTKEFTDKWVKVFKASKLVYQ